MKYAIELQGNIVVAIHSFDDDVVIPDNLIPFDNIDGIELGMTL